MRFGLSREANGIAEYARGLPNGSLPSVLYLACDNRKMTSSLVFLIIGCALVCGVDL